MTIAICIGVYLIIGMILTIILGKFEMVDNDFHAGLQTLFWPIQAIALLILGIGKIPWFIIKLIRRR